MSIILAQIIPRLRFTKKALKNLSYTFGYHYAVLTQLWRRRKCHFRCIWERKILQMIFRIIRRNCNKYKRFIVIFGTDLKIDRQSASLPPLYLRNNKRK